LKYAIAHLYRANYRRIGATQEQIEASHDKLRKYLQTMKMPSDDPAINDLLAGEMQEAFDRLLTQIARVAAAEEILE
jgi:hypothetical protein